MSRDSLILAEQMRTLDKQRLVSRMGTLPDTLMAQVERAMRMSLGLGEE
ncbi:MAG: type II toxin-antitoxin system PemK/MazF family toxin [Candidatus Spyradocola sp.]